jgi:beta-lactamase class A
MQSRRPTAGGKSFRFLLVAALSVILVAVAYHAGHNRPKPVTQATNPAATKTVTPPPSKTPATHKDAQLQQLIDTWADQQNFHASVVATELTGAHRSASRDANTTMVTASTYKLFVAYATLHEVEQGTISLHTTTRTGQTVEAALQKMILQSDNTSAEALGFLIGWDKIDSLAASVGATHTDINNYDNAGNPTRGDKHSTAADLATIVTKLQQGTLLNTSDTQLLLRLMEKQVWRERIPAGVPSGVAVADKPGWLSPADGESGYVENDAAIVYGPKSTYLLVIMTDGGSTQPLVDLSSQIYQYLEH